MPASLRPEPFIWVTWLAKMMAGEEQCYWQTWFKSNYQYSKLPSDFDNAKWNRHHTELINEIIQELTDEGLTLLLEDQTKFILRGQVATLSGKADVVAYDTDRVIIYDAKTGNQKPSDTIQVQIYMWALPRAFPQFKGRAMEGVVRYNKFGPVAVEIPSYSVDQRFTEHLVKTVYEIAGEELRRVPSKHECKWCDISSEDCPERIAQESARVVSVDDF